MINPLYIYTISYGIVLIVYSFGWSVLYPMLSYELLTFLFITGILSFFVGKFLGEIKIDLKQDIKLSQKMINKMQAILIIGYFAEFIYAGSVPLFSNIIYHDFRGIPFIHPLLVTINIFISTYLFYTYIKYKRKKYIVYYFINLIPSILLISRSIIVIILISSIFVYLSMKISFKKLFNFKFIIIMTISILIAGYLFGVTGNFRTNKLFNDTNLFSSESIISIGMPTEKFLNSKIPKEYFWDYLYISSPLANLQVQMNISNHENNIYKFILSSILPDILTKRLIDGNILSNITTSTDRISGALTVSTAYSAPYMLLGYTGMIIFYLYTVIICVVYSLLLRKYSDLYIVGVSILCTIILLNTFGNMFVYSGISFSLLWPLFFLFSRKAKVKLK